MEVLSGENTADGICSIYEKVYFLKYPTLSALIRASAMGLAALEVDTPTKPLVNAIALPQPTPPTLSAVCLVKILQMVSAVFLESVFFISTA